MKTLAPCHPLAQLQLPGGPTPDRPPHWAGAMRVVDALRKCPPSQSCRTLFLSREAAIALQDERRRQTVGGMANPLAWRFDRGR